MYLNNNQINIFFIALFASVIIIFLTTGSIKNFNCLLVILLTFIIYVIYTFFVYEENKRNSTKLINENFISNKYLAPSLNDLYENFEAEAKGHEEPKSQSFINQRFKPSEEPKSQSFINQRFKPNEEPKSQSFINQRFKPNEEPKSHSFINQHFKPSEEGGDETLQEAEDDYKREQLRSEGMEHEMNIMKKQMEELRKKNTKLEDALNKEKENKNSGHYTRQFDNALNKIHSHLSSMKKTPQLKHRTYSGNETINETINDTEENVLPININFYNVPINENSDYPEGYGLEKKNDLTSWSRYI